jgi:hypothetical protein
MDIMVVINQFSSLHTTNLYWLNSTNIALIPKKRAEEVGDFCPISLIDAIVKLIFKMMASRLAPHMDKLVSHGQNAFIKKKSIHDEEPCKGSFIKQRRRHSFSSLTKSPLTR